MSPKKEKKTILIVDDSELFLETYQIVLEDAGFAVEPVLQLNFSMSTLIDREADLVLIDVLMPGLTTKGLSELTAMMSQKAVPIPVYLFSGLDDAELNEKVKACNATGFIPKHLSMDKVIQRVREILDSKA
jgi:DNA-binding NtrC family response regulator